MIQHYSNMKALKNLLGIALISSIAISCTKDKDETSFQNSDVTDFSQLKVPTTFNWSSSIKGEVVITIDAPSYLTIENQPVEILDEDGAVLDMQNVKNGTATFYITRPQNEGRVYAHYPNTGEKMEISTSKPVFTLEEMSFDGLSSKLFQPAKKGGSIKAKTTGTNMVLGGDFENTSFLLDNSVYSKLRLIGDWYAMDQNATVATLSGSKVFTTSNASQNAGVLQSFSVDGNEIFDFSYDYQGNAGFFVLFFDGNKSFIGYTTVYTNGSQGATNFLTSNTVKHIQIYGFSSPNGWLDNVSLTKVDEPDDDNDGVVNRKDAYPNDPARAYATYFPTLGAQTLAFEDLWPSTGDYDFNDLVVSNRVEFRKDANNNLVDAVVKVKVMGLGAGLSSGLAIQLMQTNHQPFASNLITAVNDDGAEMDPEVTNGIVVFHDARKVLNPFYNNNGHGPDGTPQEFTFTITFNSSAAGQFILPDFYIYRTSERGREVHISGFPGSSAANTSLYNTGNDVNGTYKNKNGLPWAIEIIHPNAAYFHHPKEKINICEAYPKFQAWAQSSGKRYVGWMLLGKKDKIYMIK